MELQKKGLEKKFLYIQFPCLEAYNTFFSRIPCILLSPVASPSEEGADASKRKAVENVGCEM